MQVSRILARLERARLVDRCESHLDARVRRAEATPAGLALVHELDDALDGLVYLWLGGIETGAERALMPLIATLAELT